MLKSVLTTAAVVSTAVLLSSGTAAAKVHYEWNGAQAQADGNWVWVWAPATSDATLKYTYEGQTWKGYKYLFAHVAGDRANAQSETSPNGKRITGFMICPTQDSPAQNCSPWQDFNATGAN